MSVQAASDERKNDDNPRPQKRPRRQTSFEEFTKANNKLSAALGAENVSCLRWGPSGVICIVCNRPRTGKKQLT